MSRKLIAVTVALLSLVLSGPQASAQKYPTRPVSILTSAAAGSPFDQLARLFSTRLSKAWSVPVLVENATGGQGLVATQRVLQAKPDGHSLLLASFFLPTSPLIMKNAGYAAKEFSAVIPLGRVPYVLIVNRDVPADDIPSFLAYLKSNAKNINYGILTAASTGPLLVRKFGSTVGVELQEIGYRGSTEMITALMAGDIQIMSTTYSVIAPHLEAGKVKVIGVLGDERLKQLPKTSTFAEHGLPFLKTDVWATIFVRADTPPDVKSEIQSAAKTIFKDASYLDAIAPTGMDPWPIAFEDLQAYIDKDSEQFERDLVEYKLKP